MTVDRQTLPFPCGQFIDHVGSFMVRYTKLRLHVTFHLWDKQTRGNKKMKMWSKRGPVGVKIEILQASRMGIWKEV